MDENHLIDVIEVYKHINLNKKVTEQEYELKSDRDDDLPEVADPDNVAQKIRDSVKTPRATLYEHSETPGGLIYFVREQNGPYQLTTVTILTIPATDDSSAVPERTAVETLLNMSPENKEHYQSEKEEIHLLLTEIGNEI
ncbi:hypothetical protein Tco_0977384 [Tanacetum coccineum]|uniref:Uncharacterized protein n=1 Tax=Tanacetum coccineum TaxID=301880 RepID=A0ABQ5EK63_9ASTR